jgi:pimeloyl-ACP methyl ester carboxylesterase
LKRTLKFFAIALTAAFIAGCAFIETKQGEWIFSPAQGAWRGYNKASSVFEEHWIAVNATEKLHAWYSPGADKNAPVLLYLHGARWNITGSSARIPRWNKMGFSVLAIDYRGFGQSSPRTPSENSAAEDAEAAWDYLVKLAPENKHFIFGHSLGGAIATRLALKHPNANGLILEGTFTSIPDMVKETKSGPSFMKILPVGFLVTQRFDTLARIDNISMPVLFAHGTDDDIVPFNMSERLFAAANAPKRFFRAEGGNHHNLTANYFDEYSRAVKEHFGLKMSSVAMIKPAISSNSSTLQSVH